ncbi:GxxExxY protein [Aeoliella mucimassa]|uniref:GxxExxY protein n=1 Tax=Aeoliella mucimassa TaxID=2527972 RepID=UPI001E2C57BA|nr:GxxExxY protein [Aeoliella mucimassa]
MQAAFNVHCELGPGLLESVYEKCMTIELTRMGLSLKRQLNLPIKFRGTTIDGGLRIDLLVSDCVIVELKSVDQLAPIHEAQLLTYLKLANVRLGFLINFNVSLIKDGIKRMIH